jgi:hypothetical protein
LEPAEWEHFASADTCGFNEFFRQRWIRMDFHLLRAGVYGQLRWRPYLDDLLAPELHANDFYRSTIYLLPRGFITGEFANHVVGWGYLPPGSRILRYHVIRSPGPPTSSLRDGARQFAGTLGQVVNCAYALGWRDIVLVGVDLYDSRYFWLPSDRTTAVDATTGKITAAEHNNLHGTRYDEPHGTVRLGVVDALADWTRFLEARGVRLRSYNPRSLLARVMPVYEPA